jgi:hypothetical protein
MAARDKLRDRAQPYLEQGEQIHQVFAAQSGPHPYTVLLVYLPAFWMRYKIVAVTDRAVIVLRASTQMPFKPKGIEQRLDRATQIGPLQGFWATSPGLSESLGRRIFVNKRWHPDAEAADRAIGAAW